MNTDTISNIKVFPVKGNPTSKLKANVYFTVAGFISVKGTVVDGANGLFVSLPGRSYTDKESGETKWASDVKTVSKEATQKLQAEVLEAYNSFVSGGVSDGSSASHPIEEDGVPF